MELITPLGTIQVLLDGTPVSYAITKLEPTKLLCPDVAGRYKIEVDYIPDGKEHLLSCCLYPNQPINGKCCEIGKNMVSYGYYNKENTIKVSVGVRYDDAMACGSDDEEKLKDERDYDVDFTEKDGTPYNSYVLSYALSPSTKTTHYVFGCAWIFGDCTDPNRDDQTWDGADPTRM